MDKLQKDRKECRKTGKKRQNVEKQSKFKKHGKKTKIS